MLRRLWGREVLARYSMPMAFKDSTTAERKPKVVRTRPGWRGAQ